MRNRQLVCGILFCLLFFLSVGSAAAEDVVPVETPTVEESRCSPAEEAASMRAQILADYAVQDRREFIPMDPQELLRRPSRSFMQEFALYRHFRKAGNWAGGRAALSGGLPRKALCL